MESLFSLPRPFQRRLTKMYTDTKTSYEFVKEPINTPQEDPELQVLHRKLRIQKDRLVSWGLEWSDPEQLTSPDIDESINKAGLSELVGSVMGTIKEILAEAEPLWAASRRIGAGGDMGEKGEKSKSALIVWDKSRFQDLIRDLTMSIDTLYDLSRTRQSAKKIPEPRKEEESMMAVQKKKVIEERQFESSRMQTPQQVDPKSIIWPREMKTMPAGMLPPAKSHRQIVFMRRPTTSLHELRKIGMGGQSFPAVPVLLEYAPYDPIYSITGITPSLTRFEKLFAALSQSYISTGRILVGLLGLIGYFEEPEHSRFCLLYALPTHFGPIDIESPRMPSITILSDLLYSQNYEPSLEVKYRLAYNVASAVFDLHAKGVVHGNVVASNILFIEHQPQNRLDLSQVNMRQSYLTSCDLFSDNATDSSDTSPDALSLYRHSLDPRTTRYTRLTSESKSLDLYSLAMLLLEIGLWTSLHDIFPMASAIPENPVSVLKQLAARCGSLYVKAVQACWNAPNDELSQRARPDVMHQKVFFKVSKALDTCCAIDESSDESTEESDDSPPMPSTPMKVSRSSTPQRKMTSEKSTIALNVIPSTATPTGSRSAWSEKSSYGKSSTTFPEKMGWSEKPVVKSSVPTPIPDKAKSKLRTYPSLKISPELLDFWQSGLLPHINHVLRGFYKKYPESVEISLESIGETPATAKPTILVICTSVTKVRSILKKHLAYDKAVFGLKVCRGKVVRSRKHGAKRSMAHDGDVLEAANPGHQECPTNGASIGAYVDEKHLPPVSLGGMIIVDDKPYGMTVHHMLDDPSDNEDDEVLDTTAPILRSSAYRDLPDLTFSESSAYSGDEEYMYTLSDYESDIDDNSSIHSSEYDSDDEDLLSLSHFDEDQDDEDQAPGDIPGVPLGCGESYFVTQPAIDDIPSDFYPDPSTRDEDHLDSFQLGSIYASSGIRRRTENGLVHEVDWALFSYSSHRLPTANSIPGGSRFLPSHIDQSSYPTAVKRTEELSNTPVHCLARTSGLQAGRISQAMVSVKISGRQTPSVSYQVSSHRQKLGIPGDSGAWVIGNDGEVCGCVLAWSTKKGVAYICPMDVLLHDIGITLKAKTVKLPGGEVVYDRVDEIPRIMEPEPRRGRQQIDVLDESEITKMLQELKLPPTPTQIGNLATSTIQHIAGLDPSHSPSLSEQGQDQFSGQTQIPKERDAGKERERERENQKEDMSFLPMRMMSSGQGQKHTGRVSVSERSMIPQRVREGLSVSSS